MHGQKKRRKRSLDGVLIIDGNHLRWELVSEPQWTSEDGYIGLRISVQSQDESRRELILEYPMPSKKTGNGLPQLPQRPKFSVVQLESGIRQAMQSGWQPDSRGKALVFKVAAGSNV